MRIALVIPMLVLLPGILHAAGVEYTRQIKPIFEAHCSSCHGVLAQKAKLRLDHGEFIRKGGRNGPALLPKDSQNSLLMQAVLGQGRLRMPPEKDGAALSAVQIALLKQWIEEGAPTPAQEPLPRDPSQHWAFQKPRKQPIPGNSNIHPIDHYIGRGLEAQALAPAGDADRHTLARRLYLDLLGMPPTPPELELFLADKSPDAYGKLVDRLLMDPRHGERWARHWMDIWRYSDWYGRRNVPDVWNSAPQIWRWRDWIVNSINSNHGYDRMVSGMLAADEITPGDDNAVVAAGYLVRNWYALNPNDWMRNIVEHTGKAFLGLTFHCAHCHDHKYDPIRQEDYFGFRAFFEPIYVRQDRVAGEADPGPFQDYNYSTLRKIQRLGMVRVFDKTPEAPTWFYTGGDERNRLKDRGAIAPHMPAVFTQPAPKIKEVELPVESVNPVLRPLIRETLLRDARDSITLAQSGYEKARTASKPPTPEQLQQLSRAQKAYDLALVEAETSKTPGAISGRQSMILSGGKGRAVVQNSLKALTKLEEGTTLRFLVQVLEDARFTFQLSKDSTKGLTAGYVGLDHGRVMSYKPKSFTEFEAGKYNLAKGQDLLEISLHLFFSTDDAVLDVRSLRDGVKLADRVIVALNGWNPVGDPKKPIFFDAQAGCTLVIDDIHLIPPAPQAASPKNSARFQFEEPDYKDQQPVAGVDGWESSPYHAHPGYALVSSTAGNNALRKVGEDLTRAKRDVESTKQKEIAAKKNLLAAQAGLTDLEARLAAEMAAYAKPQPVNLSGLQRKAVELERKARLARGEAEVALGEVALEKAQNLEVGKRKAATDAANKQIQQGRADLQKLQGAATEEKQTPLGPIYPAKSSGRRQALARWITSNDNPLTARVAVNHVWNWHFHAPLVSTVHDFGRNGKPSTHPELLDWLAVEFMESGWDMKHLHRLMVTSNAYKRASTNTNPLKDPENIFLARMNIGRMEAEVLRDSLLSCAGKLDPTMGGQELENTEALKTFRRSIYYSIYPDGGGKGVIGDLFDGPDPLDCYRRSRSILPQQALALTNSELIHQLSGEVATGIQSRLSAGSAESDFIRQAFAVVLSRTPSAAELETCAEFLGQQPDAKNRNSLVRALFNHNDFLSIR